MKMYKYIKNVNNYNRLDYKFAILYPLHLSTMKKKTIQAKSAMRLPMLKLPLLITHLTQQMI